MEIESQLFDSGALNTEWNRLGNFKFRRNPVFFVTMSKSFPLIFIIAYILEITLMSISIFHSFTPTNLS